MADKLSKKELEQLHHVYMIYDLSGEGQMDAADAANAIRALNMNPTVALVNGLGGSSTRGEKKLPFEDFVNIYIGVKNDKDMGVYEDFIECLKLYDKLENGYMQLTELTHMLTALGEKLSNDELDECYEDCMDEENDDGEIPYIPFLARMCEKPVPKNIKPE
ncbi:myosin light chain alkali-like [Macrosteles quadrilineatus]|uniref:myosin light chain alkali-like n=1 Tax=Macrosteles quadrilineatus TaxID=74068 RepID=UPI0023E2769A|nr:myosin light chain alkali-like [Macrosteles quadrilineatus]